MESREGNVSALAEFLFDEHKDPGRVVLEDFDGDVVLLFQFLCDLYIRGVKQYNGFEPEDEIACLFLLRKSTDTFMQERMQSALGVKPMLEYTEQKLNEPVRYRVMLDPVDVQKSYLDDFVFGTRLKFSF